MSAENPFEESNNREEEQLPEGRVENPVEREPVSYEVALAAARAVREKNVENPFDLEPEDPVVQKALEVIERWESDAGLVSVGVGTVEKAQGLVKAASIWLDAGYVGEHIARGAVDRLTDE